MRKKRLKNYSLNLDRIKKENNDLYNKHRQAHGSSTYAFRKQGKVVCENNVTDRERAHTWLGLSMGKDASNLNGPIEYAKIEKDIQRIGH